MSTFQQSLRAAAATLLLGLATASQAGLVVSTQVPVYICDECTVVSTLDVTVHGTVSDVNLTLIDLRHTWVSDLEMYIVSPLGTAVLLVDNLGGSGDNYIGTVFDDQAAESILSPRAPYTGTYRPMDQLSVFNGEDMFGTWTLRVSDQAGGDLGVINSWSLQLNETAGAVPEPGSLALVMAALGAALVWRRRPS